MRLTSALLGVLVGVVSGNPAASQNPPPSAARRVAGASEQIAESILPLPDSLRAGSGVVGLDAGGGRVTLRRSTNHLVCQRIWPGEEPFDVRCYHEAFWPVVSRMLALKSAQVRWDDLVRQIHAELKAGRLAMARFPTAGYRMLGPLAAYDSTAHTWTRGMERWQSLHVPFETASQMGLAVNEQRNMPYVMASGTFWAHLMFEHTP